LIEHRTILSSTAGDLIRLGDKVRSNDEKGVARATRCPILVERRVVVYLIDYAELKSMNPYFYDGTIHAD
jgi:hypothetical protein